MITIETQGPLIVVEQPHRGPARVYRVDDADALIRIADQSDLDSGEIDYGYERTDFETACDAIFHDLASVDVLSLEEAAKFAADPRNHAVASQVRACLEGQ